MAENNKATITAYDLNDKKIKSIQVLFNPNKYMVSKKSNYQSKSVAGEDTPVPQYVSGGESTLSMELFLDTYGKRTKASDEFEDVREYVEEIRSLLDIYSDDHKPPKCIVAWGSLAFEGYLTDLTENYIMFSNEGIPVRATLSTKFVGFQTLKDQIKNTSPQSADRTKERVMKDGDQLWSFAAREYGDADLWRPIAKANNIDNPRKLKFGQTITVPSLE